MMDGWYHDKDDKISSFSSTRLPDSYVGSICSGSSADHGRLGHLESANSDLMSLNAPGNFYQIPMEDVFGVDFSPATQSDDFFPSEYGSPSTSLSSGRSLSMSSSEYSSLLHNNKVCSVKHHPAVPAATLQQQAALQSSHNPQRNVQAIASGNDIDQNYDSAILRAMMAVISSSTSASSSAASPPSVSSPPPDQPLQHRQPRGLSPAFKPYNSALHPVTSAPKHPSEGQKMIKRSITMLRRVDLSKSEAEVLEELRPAGNQLHHMISERRRREKLNWSFHELRMLLPPRSKKDKASVLNNARNYLNTLKTQIYELEEKNQRLETHLSTDQAEEIINGSSGDDIRVQVTEPSEVIGEVQLINLRITVRVECDVVELVLHILECIKGLGITEVASVDAYTYSPQMHLFARANVKFQIKACQWNEACFQEAMRKAIYGVTATFS